MTLRTFLRQASSQCDQLKWRTSVHFAEPEENVGTGGMLVAEKHHEGTAKTHSFLVRQRCLMGRWTDKENVTNLEPH